MQYWWVSLILVAICAIEVFLVWLLRDKHKLSMIVLFTVACILLLYKTTEFSYYRATGQPEYPVEFSHISYFIVGTTMILGIKKMRAFAGFCCLLAGIGYILGGVLSPDNMVTSMSSTYYVVLAVIQHELLWFCGVLLLCNIDKYSIKQIYIPLIGVAVMIIFSILVYNRIIYSDYSSVEDMVIIKIVTGNIISYLIGEEATTLAIRVVTVICITLASIGALCLYCVVNGKIFKARERRYALLDKKPDDFEMGIIPWLKEYVGKREEKKLSEAAYGKTQDKEEEKSEEDAR